MQVLRGSAIFGRTQLAALVCGRCAGSRAVTRVRRSRGGASIAPRAWLRVEWLARGKRGKQRAARGLEHARLINVLRRVRVGRGQCVCVQSQRTRNDTAAG